MYSDYSTNELKSKAQQWIFEVEVAAQDDGQCFDRDDSLQIRIAVYNLPDETIYWFTDETAAYNEDFVTTDFNMAVDTLVAVARLQ